MGFNATWSMAVGGMVGGGIFSVLGVVLEVAGAWAWLSFVIAGLIALATGISYSRLAERFGESGGAFIFLRELGREGFAGGLSWVLIIGYVLTISVYAFTFGHYLNAVFGLGHLFTRLTGVTIVVLLIGVNMLGVGEASWLEIVTVWGKLAVLVSLAAVGLWTFRPEQVHLETAQPGGFTGALLGAATIFMAYEGFQLLTYDYDDIRNPRRVLPLAVTSAILTVIVVYVIVALGSASLVGASTLVEKAEVALAEAGRSILGFGGVVIVSAAAGFSTASAINATLFATARLARTVAADGELPTILARENRHGIPATAVIVLGAIGALTSALGSLGQLVETASLAFLFTFATVNVLAARHGRGPSWVSWAGALGAAAAGLALLIRLALHHLTALLVLGLIVMLVMGARAFQHYRARRS
jgi:amino acid transporter